MRDLKILDAVNGTVEFYVRGESDNAPLMTLQKLYVKMFENPEGMYRTGDTASILSFVDGGNTPDRETMDSLLSISCARAVDALDKDDAELVDSFTATADDDMNITSQLVMADGTYIQEMIKND